MKIFPLLSLFLAIWLVCSSALLQAAFVIQDGSIRDADEVATLPVEEHFSLGVAAINRNDWKEASQQFNIIVINFPDSSFTCDSHYYLGLAYFHLEDFEFANKEFSAYLSQQNPRFFEKTIEYKFIIAEKFRKGARRHLLGWKKMPQWASGEKIALATYDEVISSVPCHEIAIRSLFAKGTLFWEMRQYKESVECFQLAIKRFPKHELAPESYLTITKIYLEQSRREFQNPDLLALAQINYRRFVHDFPREERLVEAERNVCEIKEIYAHGLYEIGQFYERTNKPLSSILYYRNAIKQFPDTEIAQLCKERLSFLSKKCL